MNLVEQLEQGLSELNNPASIQKQDIQGRVIQYLRLIEKWNKRYNLTAIKTIEGMLYQHIMDSLSVTAHLQGPQIVDIGSGAGLPGIPLAIARPDWQIVLVESNQKKAAFLQQVKIELGLVNVSIASVRVESLMLNDRINTIISRAYANLGIFVKTTCHLVSADDAQCRWIAMKGSCSEQELKEVETPFYVENKISLTVPGVMAKRELIIIARSTGPSVSDRG
ncbi:16S rRNA (guanine(527)-N(7))-methyltransferase RsmG [Nitrosomonas marina]|uniref:Ribosomal RNA small subunit methyltransferase G n=1 Tax=Nitrosomonas marina TaxID=917 RepID=A0A1H8CUR9_9PROT|nr:16S rRNA (guanine(527)-N(7))-methyltransferase RsmG [Nitrosomonas marina]SEM97897.1 16S rRNA m(7)G-527 methyltransferase [Nitrosomonas marina]